MEEGARVVGFGGEDLAYAVWGGFGRAGGSPGRLSCGIGFCAFGVLGVAERVVFSVVGAGSSILFVGRDVDGGTGAFHTSFRTRVCWARGGGGRIT